ncbi:hypothetical protein LIER_08416 [Lithospermum erythrorhizon]|uniref:Uncharacterized protein n=1 Tax=Lithospermum erythrorhizon TaxID=34254 RepID=A0AAV3PDV5_LITER
MEKTRDYTETVLDKKMDLHACEVHKCGEKDRNESELRLAQLQQLQSNEPGALVHLIKDTSDADEEDAETKACKNLFKNMKFFLSREVGSPSYFKV